MHARVHAELAVQGADGGWLRLSRTSAEYRDLATENTIAALPASILPTASDMVTETRARCDNRPVQILHRSAAAGADDAGTITATLTVDAASSLPLSELTTSAHRQRVTFGHWNQPVKVTVPRPSIPLRGS